MANREDILRDRTHKEEGMGLGRRVYYTLSDDKSLQSDRNSKAIAFLVNFLHERGDLSDAVVDELLLKCIDYG